jgi:hypothetical protein
MTPLADDLPGPLDQHEPPCPIEARCTLCHPTFVAMEEAEPTYVRPSSLNHAENCAYFIELAQRFPETSLYAARGNDVDAQNTAAILRGVETKDRDAIACIKALQALNLEGEIHAQEKVSLVDPDSGSVLTEGTPDVQVVGPQLVTTVDWKKREQQFAGYLADPDENLQLHAYSLATALARGVGSYQNVLILFGGGRAEAVHSQVYPIPRWLPFLERIRAVQWKPRTPTPGAHCANCWQRWVCSSYRERAKLALTLLPAGEMEGLGPLTDEQAALLVERAEQVKAAVNLALDLAKAHHRAGGVIRAANGKAYLPTVCSGRKTADLEALEADGLTKYIREGESYERWTWKKDPAASRLTARKG